MAQSSEEQSVVEVGRAQRGGDWPKPGDEGFVHPDGTPQSEKQLIENRQAALNREAAGSGVHGAPGQGGVQPAAVSPDDTEMAKSHDEHTEWVREQLAEIEADVDAGRHEAPAVTPTSTSSKATDSKSG